MDIAGFGKRRIWEESGENENMEKHRIGIISDTHGLLRPEAVEILKSCEAIFHAGDIDKPEVLEKLNAIGPVYAVRGNADRETAGWCNAQTKGPRAYNTEPDEGKLPEGLQQGLPKELPQEREIELFGFRFFMVHQKKHMPAELADVDAVIYGHSHKYEDFRDDETGIRYFNPGSCGPKRFRLPVTMMVLTLYPEEHRMEAERIECIRADKGEPAEKEARTGKDALNEKELLTEGNLYRLVKDVMKGIKAGKSVAELAVRNQADEKLVEDICRMYVTHPGVDADGIMDRLERRGL